MAVKERFVRGGITRTGDIGRSIEPTSLGVNQLFQGYVLSIFGRVVYHPGIAVAKYSVGGRVCLVFHPHHCLLI